MICNSGFFASNVSCLDYYVADVLTIEPMGFSAATFTRGWSNFHLFLFCLLLCYCCWLNEDSYLTHGTVWTLQVSTGCTALALIYASGLWFLEFLIWRVMKIILSPMSRTSQFGLVVSCSQYVAALTTRLASVCRPHSVLLINCSLFFLIRTARFMFSISSSFLMVLTSIVATNSLFFYFSLPLSWVWNICSDRF